MSLLESREERNSIVVVVAAAAAAAAAAAVVVVVVVCLLLFYLVSLVLFLVVVFYAQSTMKVISGRNTFYQNTVNAKKYTHAETSASSFYTSTSSFPSAASYFCESRNCFFFVCFFALSRSILQYN